MVTRKIGNLWLQEALAALEEAQQSADTTAAIQSRVAQQSEVLQQLQSQLEEARLQQVWARLTLIALVSAVSASLRPTQISRMTFILVDGMHLSAAGMLRSTVLCIFCTGR
jgi:hypothetical protein